MKYASLRARLDANSAPAACGCRLWTGRANNSGYPVFTERREGDGMPVPVYAHRAAWELANGRPVPEGHHVDHKCVTPLCIEGSHLQAVPPAENQRLKWARRRREAA